MHRRQRILAVAAVLLVSCSSTETAEVRNGTAATMPTPAAATTPEGVTSTSVRPTATAVALALSVENTAVAAPAATAAPAGQATQDVPAAGLPVPQTPPEPPSTEPVVELGLIEIPPVVPVETTAVAAPSAAAPPAIQDVPAAGLPVPQEPPDPHGIEPVVELGSIEIPRMGLNKPFFEGVTLGTLALGPGHWPGTALPGAIGNVVVGGHRTSNSRPFRYLDKLLPGDEVIFTTAAGRFVYRVVRTDIVTPDTRWIINQTAAYTATLFACHPVGSETERIVVSLQLSV